MVPVLLPDSVMLHLLTALPGPVNAPQVAAIFGLTSYPPPSAGHSLGLLTAFLMAFSPYSGYPGLIPLNTSSVLDNPALFAVTPCESHIHPPHFPEHLSGLK